jgi:hypothetical protein
MAVELITKDDLITFKNEVINEIRQVMKAKATNPEQKEWLKSFEVRKMLRISPGTLQQMRINKTIAYTRIGGLMFYKYEDIVNLMEGNKSTSTLITNGHQR